MPTMSLPERPAPQRPKIVCVRHDNQNFSGTWRLEDGVVFLNSPYGSRQAVVDWRRPSSVAEGLLREVARAWKPIRREM